MEGLAFTNLGKLEQFNFMLMLYDAIGCRLCYTCMMSYVITWCTLMLHDTINEY